MLNLNLGCGRDYKTSAECTDWVNIDYNPNNRSDLCVDLELAKLPFESDSVDHVYANQIFEHIHNFVNLMIEIHRVMKDGASMFVSVPLFPCEAAITDPEHCRFFTTSSFKMFCDPTHAPYFKGAGLFKIENLVAKIPVLKGLTEKECSDFSKILEVTLTKTKWNLKDGVWENAGK